MDKTDKLLMLMMYAATRPWGSIPEDYQRLLCSQHHDDPLLDGTVGDMRVFIAEQLAKAVHKHVHTDTCSCCGGIVDRWDVLDGVEICYKCQRVWGVMKSFTQDKPVPDTMHYRLGFSTGEVVRLLNEKFAGNSNG